VNLYNSVTGSRGCWTDPRWPKKIGTYFNNNAGKFTEFYHHGDFIDINDEFLYAVFKSKVSPMLKTGD